MEPYFCLDFYSLFYIRQKEDTLYHIWMYDLQNKEESFFSSFEGAGIREIVLRNNFVSVVTNENEMIWDKLNQKSIGAFKTKLKTSGLSADGDHLVTQNPKVPSALTVYKICSDE